MTLTIPKEYKSLYTYKTYDFAKDTYIPVYTYRPANREIIVPAGSIYKLPATLQQLVSKQIRPTLKFTVEKLDKAKLRGYQYQALETIGHHLSKNSTALLKAGAGSGKSYTLPYLLEALDRPKTLILVDRVVLLEQMVAEFKSKGIKLTKLTKTNITNIDKSPYMISTLQSMMRRPELTNKFDLLVVDECHLVSVGKLSTVVSQSKAPHILGLTATPSRSDGLTNAMFDTFGPITTDMTNEDLLKVSIKTVSTSDIRGSTIQLTEVALAKGRVPLIYNTSVDEQYSYVNYFKAKGYKVALLNSYEKDNLQDADLIVAGRSIEKGVSIPRLDIILATSLSTKESTEQLLGRLRRDHKDKQTPLFLYLHSPSYTPKVYILRRLAKNLGDTLLS